MMFIYLIKCSMIWALSLVIYLSLYRSKTQFRINRSFLLGTLLCGIVLPIIQHMQWLNLPKSSPLSQVIVQQHSLLIIPEVMASDHIQPNILENSGFDFSALLLSLYLFGLVITLAKFCIGLFMITKIHRIGKLQIREGQQLIVHNLYKPPFSFFNYVYLNENLLNQSSIDVILKHESAHINGKHSFDLIFIEILKIIFWFHPFVYLYKKLIKEVHEFIADHQACQFHDSQEYCLHLIKPSNQASLIKLGSNFFTNNLKKRITMINKKTENSKLVYYIVLPIFLISLSIWSCNSNEEDISATQYKIGAQLEKIISSHYYNTGIIMSNYMGLIEEYPEHLVYIRKRIQEHFINIGAEVMFDHEEIKKKFDDSGYPSENHYLTYCINDPGSKLSKLPTLIPIRKRDLKKTIIPDDRFHPFKKKAIKHSGVDYIADLGSPVLASGDGVITSVSNYINGYGNCIRIDHDNGMETFYAHLSEINVKKGDYVTKGSTIGAVGASGQAVSPHLHFELLRDGKQ